MLEVYVLNISEPLEMQYKEAFLQKVSEEKRQKIMRYRRIVDGQRTLLGEILIKVMLSKHLKRPVEQIGFKKNEYGKPCLENSNLHFNISHSGEWVVGAISDHLVGIDVEEIKQADLGIAERFFTKAEYEMLEKIESSEVRNALFYTLWSGKESYIKMIGKGLTIPLDGFELAYVKEHLQLTTPYEGIAASFNIYPLHKGKYSFVICSSIKHSNIVYEKVDYKMLYNNLQA